MPSIRAALGIATALLGASCHVARAQVQGPPRAPNACMIVGHVLGQNGEPFRDAEVWVTAPDAPDKVVRRTRTDGDGMFVLGRLETNAVNVYAKAPSMTTARFDATKIANTPTLAVGLRLWEARTVRGRILDPDGQPIADASLAATNFAHSSFVMCAPVVGTTDAQGRFELYGVPVGECVVNAIAPGFALDFCEVHGMSDERVDLQLRRHDGQTLRIEVQGLPESAARATRVRLHAQDMGHSSMPHLFEPPQLAADGSCTVKGVPETLWSVSLSHPEYRFATPSSRVRVSKEPALVRLVAQAIEQVNVRGRVLADGKPVAAQQIVLHSGASYETAAPMQKITDDQGRFEFMARLPAGSRLRLQLVDSDLVLDQAQGPRLHLSHTGQYEVTAPPTEEIQLTAVRPIPLRGRVVDKHGKAVPLVAVELQRSSGEPGASDGPWDTHLRTTTAIDGSFAFPNLLASKLALRIRTLARDAIGYTEPFLIVAGPGVERNVTVRPTGRVEGRLLDPSGEVVRSGCLLLSGEDDARVITDSQGRFVFVGVEPGSYRLAAWSRDKWQPAEPEEFEVRSGETARRDVTLQ